MINATTRVGGIAISCCSTFTADNIFIRWIKISFVEQDEEPAIYLSWYWFWWSLGIQYIQSSHFVPLLREDTQDLWLFRISSLSKVVRLICGITWVVTINALFVNKATEEMQFTKKKNKNKNKNKQKQRKKTKTKTKTKNQKPKKTLFAGTITYFSCSEKRHSSSSRSLNTELGLLFVHFLKLSILFRTNDQMAFIQGITRDRFLILGPFLFKSMMWHNLQHHTLWFIPYIGVHSQWYSNLQWWHDQKHCN